ncbi:unnamed protein product [Effrenium voratum]|uniref:Uncharacterized protein n=1 Tax=Effrenium voratum TaxID=2562239 RepID=A0AA36IB70_9DINO|nr:unnamed protein product [Effrenium voratum]
MLLFLAREERRKAAAVTSSLQRGADRLKEANKISAETEVPGRANCPMCGKDLNLSNAPQQNFERKIGRGWGNPWILPY